MQTELIIVSEYCRKTNLDPTFFTLLEEGGLIAICIEEGERYFPAAQLPDLERYARLHYDLSINIEGIDVIHNLQIRMQELEYRINYLQSKLSIYEPDL
ncbi:MAG: chaperone modulator CbpM [Tannerellaceae bacterium]|jgi:hypothetical protein|nr:chaperone modulator CbpM [Tannerellaceae bacterium]